ncbi:hypothetical protein AB0P32_03285 [Streptomyces sp. NPDC085995]|uniref:hypothetical protein n=1 Tax=Streptomyces sp. NPDC085995 TaxID=3154861 RepID=UPI003435A3A7
MHVTSCHKLAAATATVTVGIALFASAAPASANSGEGTKSPQIISDQQYAREGNPDPRTVAPTGAPAPVTGESVRGFTDLLAKASGLEAAGNVLSENYGDFGTSLRFDLGVETETPVAVTRVDTKGDVPQSALTLEDAETAVSMLPTGTRLVTSLSPEAGAMVSTLSPAGQLTVWDSPAARTPAALKTVVEWAESVDAKDPGRIDARPQAVMRAAAKPSCTAHVYTPWTHDRKVGVSGALICNQKGSIKLSVYLEQYRGLWIWKMMSVGTANFSGVSTTNATPEWKCSKGAGSQLYRGRMQTRQLVNGNGKWWATGSVYGPQKRLVCG